MTTTVDTPTPPAARAPRPSALSGQARALRPGHRRAGDPRQLPQAGPARAAPQPGDLRGRDRQRLHVVPVLPRSLDVVDERERVRRPGRPSSSGRRSCSPTSPRRWPKAGARHRPPRSARRARETMAHRRLPDGTVEEVSSSVLDVGDECIVVGRRGDPVGRRRDRRHRVGRRVGDHRRVGSRDPGVGWRPLRGHRRHPRPVRRDRRADHVPSPGRPSSTG